MTELPLAPEAVMLERLRVAAAVDFAPAVLESLEVRTIQSLAMDRLRFQLHAEVYGQRIASGTATESTEVTHEWPATTWQMFKHRHRDSWWLRWFVRRRPVQLQAQSRQVTLTTRWDGWAKFPDSSIIVHDNRLGAPVYMLRRISDWRVT